MLTFFTKLEYLKNVALKMRSGGKAGYTFTYIRDANPGVVNRDGTNIRPGMKLLIPPPPASDDD